MTSLLYKLNLEDRILYEDKATDFNVTSVYKEVDNRVLDTLVIDSINYLKKAIGN